MNNNISTPTGTNYNRNNLQSINQNILKINFITFTTNSITSNSSYLYTPSMSNPSLYSKFPNILFIPSIKITKGLFDKQLSEEDIKKIFLSPSDFDNFIMRIKYKELNKSRNINDAKTKNIIYNNIKFILDLFFKKNDKLFINNNQYIINNYTWNNKYNLIPGIGKKNPTVEIILELFLHKGEHMSFIESTRLNCMQNKQSIINDYYQLVGIYNKQSDTAPVSSTNMART